MKFLPSLLLTVSASLLLATTDASAQKSVQQMLSEAQTTYIRGDMAAAEQQFRAIVQIEPRNQIAIRYLGMIKAAKNKAPKGNEVEKQLAAVMIPKIEFKEATLGSALEYLKQTVAKASGGKASVNFVVQLPEQQVNTQTVTLSLTNVPFTEVLRYIGGLANIQFDYDRYAVIVRPKGAAAATASAEAAK
jgi:hypothetical protein